MKTPRKIVLSIAGYDPSGGAGVLADCKTFEQHRLLGMAVSTALTVQNEKEIKGIYWSTAEQNTEQLALLAHHKVEGIKLGLFPNLETLHACITQCKKLWPKAILVWDTILKASEGTEFLKADDTTLLSEILNEVHFLTPNQNELEKLVPNFEGKWTFASNLVLTGGHNTPDEIGVDNVYLANGKHFVVNPKKASTCSEKHGSGCVFSSALLCNILHGYPLLKSVLRAKKYTERVLSSNKGLLGYHKF